MQSPERATPYIPQYRVELRFAGKIAAAKITDRVGLVALYGGILIAVGGLVMEVGLQLPLEALAAYIVGGLAVFSAVLLFVVTLILHIVASLQAFSIRRTFPQNPLPAKFLHAEFVRWIHRVDLVLITAATVFATFASFGFAAGITIPSGLGLGFIGWAITEIWGFGANRAVNKEVTRQKRLAKVLVDDPRRHGTLLKR
jgi:hypothetical protein